MSKRNGQQISEIAIVGGVIFSVCALSVFLFGDQIGNVFSSNKSISMFGGSRSNVAARNNNSINATSISINGQSFNAPVDKVLLSKLSSNSIQTSGSSGNVEETVKVLEEYVTQLKALLATMSPSTQRDAVISAIAAYEQAIKDYKNMDNQIGNEANRQLVKDLDITTNLEVSGTNAVLFNDTMTALMTSLDPTSTNYKMLNMYKNGMLNLGQSMDYTIDSRNSNFNAIISPYETSFNTKMSELLGYLKSDELKAYFTDEQISAIQNTNSFSKMNELTAIMAQLGNFTDPAASIKKSDNIDSITDENVGISIKTKDTTGEIKLSSLSDTGTLNINNEGVSRYSDPSKTENLIKTVFGEQTFSSLGIDLSKYSVFTDNTSLSNVASSNGGNSSNGNNTNSNGGNSSNGNNTNSNGGNSSNGNNTNSNGGNSSNGNNTNSNGGNSQSGGNSGQGNNPSIGDESSPAYYLGRGCGLYYRGLRRIHPRCRAYYDYPDYFEYRYRYRYGYYSYYDNYRYNRRYYYGRGIRNCTYVRRSSTQLTGTCTGTNGSRYNVVYNYSGGVWRLASSNQAVQNSGLASSCRVLVDIASNGVEIAEELAVDTANAIIDGINDVSAVVSEALTGEDTTQKPIYLVNKSSSNDPLTKNQGFEVIKLSFDSSGNPVKEVYTNIDKQAQKRKVVADEAVKKINEILELKKEMEIAIKNFVTTTTTDLTNTITVYRNGTYQDILPDSYNGEAICKTLGKQTTNGNCSL